MRPIGSESSGFFSSREMMRLISGIFLIGVVGLMAVQVRKTAAWRAIAAESTAETVIAPVSAIPWVERVVPHPGHTDPEEIDALKEELQAVSDQKPMAAEEMAAYWRMVKWAYAVPGADLRKQARSDLVFTHLQQAPDKYRGALIELKLNVRRIVSYDAPPNSAEAKTVYEASGPTDESGVYPYTVIVVEMPPEIPVTYDVDVRARFVGFFLKQLPYHDKLGTNRYAPLLIGRLIHDPALAPPVTADDGGLSVPWIVGIVLGLTLLVGLTQLWGRTSKSRPRPAMHDEETVDAFLDGLETGSPTVVPPESPDRPPSD